VPASENKAWRMIAGRHGKPVTGMATRQEGASPAVIVFRCCLALAGAWFYYYIEGAIPEAVLLALLLLFSSLPFILLVFFVNYTFPLRYAMAIPGLDAWLEIAKTTGYPFHFLMGLAAVLFMAFRSLLASEVRRCAAQNRLQPLLRLVMGGCAAAGCCMLLLSLLRRRPLVTPLGWALIFFAYAIAFFRLPGITFPALPYRAVRNICGQILMIILLTVILLEICLRLTFPQPPAESRIFTPDATALYALRQGNAVVDRRIDNQGNEFFISFNISSQGWRDAFMPPKKTDEFRILMLGDSFTMGYSTTSEQSIPNQLEEMLAGAGLPCEITVINAGVMSTSPWQQRVYLRERGFPLEPDLVIHQIFPPNDIDGSLIPVRKYLRAYSPELQRGLEAVRNWQLFPVKAERWLRCHAWSYYYLSEIRKCRGLVQELLSKLRFFSEPDRERPPAPEDRPHFLETSLKAWYPELEEGFARMTADIQRVCRDCRERGIDYAAWAAPGNIQLDSRIAEEFSVIHGPIYDVWKPFRMTEDFFREAGIPWFSVRNALEGAKPASKLFYEVDGHYNDSGCRVVAEAVLFCLSWNRSEKPVS
jgi:hypothetical protein